VLHYIHKKLIRPIFTINDTPHSIALGVTLGVFVSLTPTVGIQMLLAVIIGTFIKANRIIAALLCWISNPITILPMYYSYYWLGGKILGIDLWTFGNFSDRLNELILTKEQLGYFSALKQLGFETALPLWVGSLIIATILTLPVYPLTLYALHRHRNKRLADSPPAPEGDQIAFSRNDHANSETYSEPMITKEAASSLSSCSSEYVPASRKEE
jgi:uncharacterized protein (DUF2062 family)